MIEFCSFMDGGPQPSRCPCLDLSFSISEMGLFPRIYLNQTIEGQPGQRRLSQAGDKDTRDKNYGIPVGSSWLLLGLGLELWHGTVLASHRGCGNGWGRLNVIVKGATDI